MTIDLPIKTVSESNWAGALRTKMRRKKAQREAAFLITKNALNRGAKPPAPIRRIRMVRRATRLLDPGNLPSAMKHCQDGLCQALKIDDGPRTGIDWKYDQRVVGRNEIGVTVEIG